MFYGITLSLCCKEILWKEVSGVLVLVPDFVPSSSNGSSPRLISSRFIELVIRMVTSVVKEKK